MVVEKPITPTSAEAFELAALAKEKNLVLAVYQVSFSAFFLQPLLECLHFSTTQSRRYDSDFLTVKDLVAKGTFGELSEFQVSSVSADARPRSSLTPSLRATTTATRTFLLSSSGKRRLFPERELPLTSARTW